MKCQANNLANVDKLWIKPMNDGSDERHELFYSGLSYCLVRPPAMWAAPLTQSSREGGHRIRSTATFSDGLIFQYPLSSFLSNSKKNETPKTNCEKPLNKKRMLLSHPSKTQSHYSISQTSWFFEG